MSTGTTSSPRDNRAQLTTATSLLKTIASNGAAARALGGVAVALRCEHARSPAPLARTWSDLDLVIDRPSAQNVAAVLATAGYEGARRFNALHGHSRMLFARDDGAHVDVFVEEFVMCHRLQLGRRLRVHELTVPLADLLLTKLQVAELNAKDVTDVAALLLDHALTEDESGINVRYIRDLLGRDWGWWRTVDENLRRMVERAPDVPLEAQDAARLRGRLYDLVELLERTPKSVRWRLRARAGDRIPWRDEPEESH